MHRAVWLAGLLLLGGCATGRMTEAECHVADWRAVGFEDGSQGLGADHIGVHRRSCAEHGVTPHFEDYLDGHAQGIETFCRPANGAELGSRGTRYGGSCPEHLEPAFLDAYELGFGLYERKTALGQISRALSTKRRRAETLEKKLAEKTAAVAEPGLSPAERVTLAHAMKELGEEKGALASEIRRLEDEREDVEYDYESYRRHFLRQSFE